MAAYPPAPAERVFVRLWRSISGSPHLWLNSLVAVLALLVSVGSGLCSYQSQLTDRELAEANRLRDQEAQQSALEVTVLSIDVPKVLGSETELRIELRVSNVGGSATSVVAARAASLADRFVGNAKYPFITSVTAIKWALTDPPPPSHVFRPAIRIEPGSAAELSVRIRLQETASTLDELRKILTATRDLAQLRIEDLNGRLSSVTLWDCAPKFPPKPAACTGAVFAGAP